jgi:hypothetical protein
LLLQQYQEMAHVCLAQPKLRASFLQAAPRVMFMRAFAHLFEGKPSGLNTLNILRGNSYMIGLQHSINQTVIDDFTYAREAVRVSVDLQRYLFVQVQKAASPWQVYIQ